MISKQVSTVSIKLLFKSDNVHVTIQENQLFLNDFSQVKNCVNFDTIHIADTIRPLTNNGYSSLDVSQSEQYRVKR